MIRKHQAAERHWRERSRIITSTPPPKKPKLI